MLKTSGLVIDVHDDVGGEVLRSFFPVFNDIPEVIKTAHALSSDERDHLPDEDFALVLVDGDQKLRKFACIDEGNTRLSLLYFAANGHKLPTEAQKVAAANLSIACQWYGLQVPAEDIEKTAGIGDVVTKGLGLMSVPSTLKGAHSQMKQNMAGIRANEAAGSTVVSPAQMKMAEVSGTSLMPTQAPSDSSVKPSKTVVTKVATELENNLNVTKKEQPDALPQAKIPMLSMGPHVDVSNKEPPKVLSEKKASRYALDGQYPLDTYEQVKKAAAYFEEYGKRMDHEDRHVYCANLVKRASELSIEVSKDARKYGSETYAPEEEIKVAMDARRRVIHDDVCLKVLDELQEKIADIDPDMFCVTLAEFDKIAGINFYYDSYIPDPYYSTYGVKEAEEYSFIDGNDMITAQDLVRFGKTMHRSLHSSFGSDFADEFRKDPVSIFKSMPLVQKKMIMHLATDNAPGAEIIP